GLDVDQRAALHLEVEEQDVARCPVEEAGELVRAVDLGDDVESWLETELRLEALAEEGVVVGDRDAEGGVHGVPQAARSAIARWAPARRLRSISICPPSWSTRDAIDQGGRVLSPKPSPSSSIRMCSWPSTQLASIDAERAMAWRRTLRAASSMIWRTCST